MSSIKIDVRRAFGIADKRFAGHPIEEQCARDVRDRIKRGNYTSSDAIAEARDYLVSQRCTQEHIEEQMGKVVKAWG